MRTSVVVFATVLLLGAVMLPVTTPAPAPVRGPMVGGTSGVANPIGIDLPDGHFAENLGQVRNEDVRFYLSSGNVNVGFAIGAVLMAVVEQTDQKPDVPPPFDFDQYVAPEDPVAARGVLVRISFTDSHVVEPEGRGELSFMNNYFLGNDPSKWRTGVRNYREVVYEDLYDGIDLVYGVKDGHLKYEFHVSPGADPRQIEIAYEGVDRLLLDIDGGMTASTSLGNLRDLAPVSYQESEEIKCPFSLRGPFSFGFACQGWDDSRALVIDPLVYSTFLGGGNLERVFRIATDPSGNVHVVGFTRSSDFPATPGAFDVSYDFGYDGFVAKLNPNGSSLAWATFLGGLGDEWANGVAIDSIGDIYVVGETDSTDFPVTMGAYDTSFNGIQDAFVARFTGDGVLTWATYLGGTDGEMGHGIALDSSGNMVVVSWTKSSDFPVTPGAFDTSHDGDRDVYIAKLDPSGATLLWATFLGGSGYERIWSVTLGADDSIYATGVTNSTDFFVTPGAFDTTLNGSTDAFIAKMNPTGSALFWATYLGGAGSDGGGEIVLDRSGDLYVTVGTSSIDFPVTPGAFDVTQNGTWDTVIAKLNSIGSDLVWATYLGGSGSDTLGQIAMDVAGDIWVAGITHSADIPITPCAFDTTFNGTSDGYLSRLNPNGTGLLYATFLGGSSGESIYDMVLGSPGYAYLAGYTNSADFPVTPGAFDTTYNGGDDVFVTKIGPGPPNTPPVLAWTGEPNYVSDGLDPETGTILTDFTYRVAYYDAENNSPAQINVKIEKPLGTPYGTFPMSFASWKGMPNNYTTGATYTFSTKLPAGTDFWYYFCAMDGCLWATGPPTVPIDAPDVISDNPPVAVAQAFPTSAFMGDTIAFDATASTDDFGITAYLWDFGDTTTDINPLTTHAYTSRGTFLANLTVWDTINQSDTDMVSISIGNRPPIADAGPDQNVAKNEVVTLNGTGSSDPDGDPLTYLWNQTGGPPVVLAGADTAMPTFSSTVSGTCTFLLTVDDGWGGSSNDTVNITVVNRAPIADAGPDQTVPKKTLVTLDGTGSSDPDGDILTYAWTQTGGPAVVLTGADIPTPTFTPPKASLYTFQLTVDDNDGGIATDTVVVTATNVPPVADAGSNQTVRKNTLVTLDSSFSYDSDGDVLTHSWTQVFGSNVTLTDADTATPTFTPSEAGTYIFRLSVDDGDGGMSEDTVTITVWGLPPTADLVARPPSTHVGMQIEFDGSGSTDPDGTIVDFEFSFGDNTSDHGISPVRDHSYTSAGIYTVTLTVTDDDGNTSTAQVTVEVTEMPSPEVETNYKPLVALIFAIVLAVIGLWSSRRRPWKGGKDGMAVAKAFIFISLPFILAEAATGVVSLLTGQLSMPPIIGLGTAVDLLVLVVGLVVGVHRILRKAPSLAEGR
jgi:PKD repeat protein